MFCPSLPRLHESHEMKHEIESGKTPLARISLVLLLLAGVTAATLSTFALPFAPKNIPACHGSETPPPSPSPADHRCCAVGHQHAALTRAASAESPATTLVFVFALRNLFAFAPSQGHENAANLNPSPPTAAPLRI